MHTSDSSSTSFNSTISRRGFIQNSVVLGASVSLSASTWRRAQGANERLRVGLIGCGDRGINALMNELGPLAQTHNVEVVAVCDPWRQHREEAVAKAKEWFGTTADAYVSYRDLLPREDVDAVMIASCDHLHTLHLEAAARAGKDIYCEKPLAKDFEKLKSACQAVKESAAVVQVGTQLRSLPSMAGAKAVFEAGRLGNLSRIEQCRNSARPYWYNYSDDVRAEDVDWGEFLGHLPERPFTPHHCWGWYGYRDFSEGPVPGFGSHYIDLVHYITGAQFPASCVCSGGTFTWKDEYAFTCPDHVQAQWIYPEGFLVSYSSHFGNGEGNSFKMFGNQGLLDLEKWSEPVFSDAGSFEGKNREEVKTPVEPIPRPGHMQNWVECIRSREETHAPIEAGYRHAVAVIMAMKAFDSGKRQIYDPELHKIREG